MAFQGDSIFWVEVEKIVANPYQPRREFDEERLRELAESIRMYGVLQPLTVTRREVLGEDGSFKSEYELIAGERRLRASKLAGLVQVPVIIREGEQSEQEKLELAIIENLQREDLNAVDRALAFRQLSEVFGLSHAQVAKKVGRSREYVSNSIRLLALPGYMLDALKVGDITEGHARTLLMLNDRPEEQDTLFRETLLKKLTVREVERIARSIATEKVRKKESIDSDLIDLEQKFTETLGTRVSIVKTEFGGRMTIDYFSQEELMEILERMRADANAQEAASGTDGEESLLGELANATPIIKPQVPAVPQPVAPASIPTVLPVTPAPVPAVPVPAAPIPPREPEPAPRPVSAEPVPAPTVAAVQPAPASVASRPTPTPSLAPSVPVAAAVPVSMPTPAPTPSAAPSVSEPAPAPSGQNALRDRLAMLLKKPVPTGAAPSPAMTEPVQEPAPLTPVSPAPAAAPPVPPMAPEPAKKDDDSSLYSINSFTI